MNRINGAKYQSGPNAGQDSIVGDAVNDAYYTSPLDEIAYIGRTDGGRTTRFLSVEGAIG